LKFNYSLDRHEVHVFSSIFEHFFDHLRPLSTSPSGRRDERSPELGFLMVLSSAAAPSLWTGGGFPL